MPLEPEDEPDSVHEAKKARQSASRRRRFVRDHFREIGAVMRGELTALDQPVGRWSRKRRSNRKSG